MAFEVKYKSQAGGYRKVVVLSDNFEEVRKKFLAAYEKNLVSIIWKPDSPGEVRMTSEKI